MQVPALVLPSSFRKDFSQPQGTLVVHPEKATVAGLVVDVTVGDVVSENHISKIKVVDYKTLRRKLEGKPMLDCIVVVNPRGHISINALTMSKLSKNICVVGEEDLLVIAYLNSAFKSVIYGQPGVGPVVVKPDVHKALKVLKILKPAVVQLNKLGD